MNRYIVFILTVLFFVSFSLASADDLPLETPTPCANITHPLRVGSNDEQTNGDVTSLQSFLQDEGYLSIDPTGYYGNVTARAVKKFQLKYKISPVGSVGVLTRKKIKQLTCAPFTVQNATEDTNSTSTLSGLAFFQSNPILQLLPPVSINFPTASSTLKMGMSYDIS